MLHTQETREKLFKYMKMARPRALQYNKLKSQKEVGDAHSRGGGEMDVLCVQKADDIVCAKVLFFSISLSAMWMNSSFNFFPAQMSACVYHLVATSSAEQRLRGIVENNNNRHEHTQKK